MTDPPLDQLVNTLIVGTQANTVQWQEATGDGNSFITRRPSGTITIQRRGSVIGVMAGEISLVVNDAYGDTVTQIDSPTPSSTITGTTSSAGRRLRELFDVVSAKHTGDHPQLQRLISEFETPG